MWVHVSAKQKIELLSKVKEDTIADVTVEVEQYQNLECPCNSSSRMKGLSKTMCCCLRYDDVINGSNGSASYHVNR